MHKEIPIVVGADSRIEMIYKLTNTEVEAKKITKKIPDIRMTVRRTDVSGRTKTEELVKKQDEEQERVTRLKIRRKSWEDAEYKIVKAIIKWNQVTVIMSEAGTEEIQEEEKSFDVQENSKIIYKVNSHEEIQISKVTDEANKRGMVKMKLIGKNQPKPFRMNQERKQMLEGGIIYVAIKSTITVVEIIYKLVTGERQEICQIISEQITGVRRPITTKETTKIDIPKIVPEPEPELEPDPEEDIIGKAMKTILEKAIMNRTYSTTKKMQTSTKSNNTTVVN